MSYCFSLRSCVNTYHMHNNYIMRVTYIICHANFIFGRLDLYCGMLALLLGMIIITDNNHS